MSFLKNNLDALKKKNPILTERLLQFKRHESKFPAPASAEIQGFLNTASNEAGELLLVFGLGDGAYLEPLLIQEKSHRPIFILEESEDMLCQALFEQNLADAISSHVFLFGPERLSQQLYDAFQHISLPEQVSGVPFHPSYNTNPSFYQKAWEQFSKCILTYQTDLQTSYKDSWAWNENTWENVTEMLVNPPAKVFWGSLSNYPAVVVSAGPSLDKNISLLKDIQDRAVLLSVAAALEPLLHHGIRPHFVFALDASPESFVYLENAPSEKLTLVTDLMVFPRVLQDFQGKKFIARISTNPTVKFFEETLWELGWLRVGFSVSTMAFSFAKALGCSPIILTGQDLSFSESGSSYAAGCRKREATPATTVEIPGYYGKPVKTTNYWISNLTALEVLAGEAQVPVINATEGGAYITGCEHMPLQNALNLYLPKNASPVTQKIEELQSRMPALPDPLNSAKKLQAKISELQEKCNALKARARDTADLAKIFFKKTSLLSDIRSGGQEVCKLDQKLTQSLNELNKQAVVIDFIRPWIQKELGHIKEQSKKETPGSREHFMKEIELSRNYSESIMKGLEHLHLILEETRDRLSLFLRERT